LRPLSSLAKRAETIHASSLQLRFPTDNIPVELLPIAQRLNDLLARLEASFAREQRFSADVAHELRTPIAELRTLAEVALKWPDDVNQAALKEALNIALQMESVATGLMALARCDGRPAHSQP
jgi:two-component system sensor histidine kinase QseC